MTSWPTDMMDDRLAFVGNSGSGKTYSAKGLAEPLISSGARVCIIDPLGVWWGLRSGSDGDASGGLPVTIFGGLHADIEIIEGDGAALGQIVAGTDIRCVIDISELGSDASRRRFMLRFTEALYSSNRSPLHLIIDEADFFAPQSPDKDGPGAELLGRVNQIVRRGRVHGFIPWLITQRPAVLNKNVLSQADILIAMKLTSSQDRAAIGAWIEGQADREEGKRILGDLPRLPTGTGYVWAPGHGMLERIAFPAIMTFDSSKTPKRGEMVNAASLAPVDTAAIVAALTKNRTPLKVEKSTGAEIAQVIDVAYQQGYDTAQREATVTIEALRNAIAKARVILREVCDAGPSTIELMPPEEPGDREHALALAVETAEMFRHKPVRSNGHATHDASLAGPQRQLLAAIMWWRANGHLSPTRAQVAAIAGWKITSGHLKNVSGSLRTLGLIDYPTSGTLTLTDEGHQVAPPPDLSLALHDRVRSTLSGPQRQVFDTIRRAGRQMTRDQICRELNWEPTSGHVKNVLGSMRTLELIDYPRPSVVSLQGWLR